LSLRPSDVPPSSPTTASTAPPVDPFASTATPSTTTKEDEGEPSTPELGGRLRREDEEREEAETVVLEEDIDTVAVSSEE